MRYGSQAGLAGVRVYSQDRDSVASSLDMEWWVVYSVGKSLGQFNPFPNSRPFLADIAGSNPANGGFHIQYTGAGAINLTLNDGAGSFVTYSMNEGSTYPYFQPGTLLILYFARLNNIVKVGMGPDIRNHATNAPLVYDRNPSANTRFCVTDFQDKIRPFGEGVYPIGMCLGSYSGVDVDINMRAIRDNCRQGINPFHGVNEASRQHVWWTGYGLEFFRQRYPFSPNAGTWEALEGGVTLEVEPIVNDADRLKQVPTGIYLGY